MSEPPSREPETDIRTDPKPERGDGYFRNGVWVPRNQDPDPKPPTWRDRLEALLDSRWSEPRMWLPAAVVLVVLIVLIISAASGPAQAPAEQRDFLTAIKRGQTDVSEGNDITIVTATRDRARRICGLLPRDGAAVDWVGTIEDVGTIFGGTDGHLSLSIGNDVDLKTWTSGSDDAKDHTLIDPDSEVYRALSELHSGDEVKFSGTFAPRGRSCIHETSIRARNGMLTPGFIFDFTAVAPR
jgi:hypothetical protein